MISLDKKRIRFNKGFTLIEMMVSVSIFAIVMTISAGALFSILDANAKSQALKSVMNNLNLALEGMGRNIRVGSSYHCGSGNFTFPQDCVSGGASSFSFNPSGSESELVTYDLQNFQIMRKVDDEPAYSITAPEVRIESLRFYVRGSTIEDTIQPQVLIVVRGEAGVKEKYRTKFDIQTVVSQRLLDIDLGN